MNYLISFFFTLLSLPLFAVIIETPHFQNLTQYIEAETLVILDIDDTLLLPVQTLGSDVWFVHRLQQLKKMTDPSSALDKALAEWEAIRHLTKVQIVEEGSDRIVKELQDKNIPVMCLTTQGLALATRTVNQLRSLNIEPTLTAPSKEDLYFINQHGVLYRQGVLFTSGSPKGPALIKLLDLMKFHPKHIVFINDKETHLRDVEESVLAQGIRFTGLRYTYGDERVARFNPEITDIQWERSTLDHLLSDEEALLIHSLKN